MKNYISRKYPILLIGSAGCGKTQVVKGLLKDLNSKEPENYLFNTINFNYFTNADILQVQLGLPPLEKKAGITWAPKGKALLIYFVDDLNMP
jgi:dynein heavy chain